MFAQPCSQDYKLQDQGQGQDQCSRPQKSRPRQLKSTLFVSLLLGQEICGLLQFMKQGNQTLHRFVLD